MDLSRHIFREYDIRGIVGTDLDARVTRQVGRAFASELSERSGAGATVAVGQDNRPHSPELADGLIAGLRAAGADVVHLGTVPTPVVLWAEKKLGVDAAIQITGSHNPSEYNGIKMSLGGNSFCYSNLSPRVSECLRDAVDAVVLPRGEAVDLKLRLRF